MRWQRPETHQNLIHHNKERHLQLETPPASRFPKEIIRGNHQHRLLSLLRDTRPVSSITHPSFKGSGGGDRTRTDDPLLAKQVLSQLSYTPVPEVGDQRSEVKKGRLPRIS